ncbi:DUF1289 domain-containing protein [Shewanella subflava]|uniref:DUF1289 domain-containing protein n=1 Tax=Shewanella subflava TaxID=2986476 RepID=A0ABT3IAE5_9GAMM|nr:DUF1289 domain-containing protein [Shewanella subflava]MCW3173028.1 DUF1289 domain-containing protein [Shewanella subflava]
MEQLSFFAVPSPCIGICQTDPKGYCLGCFRSRDERFNWMSFSELQKQDVIRLCAQRKRRRQYAIFNARKLQQQQLQASINTQLDFDASDDNDVLSDVSDFKLD